MRTAHQQRIDEFMRLANQEVPNEPLEEPSEELRLLRAKIVYEEVVPELIRDGLGVHIRTTDYHDNPTDKVKFDYSIGGPFNLIETIDGCIDASVVITGTLSALGIPDEPFLIEVDNNNLAKFGPGGYRSDGTDGNPEGKWIKPPGHPKPDIAGVLEQVKGRCRATSADDPNRDVATWVAESKEIQRDVTEQFVICAAFGQDVAKDAWRYVVLDLDHPDKQIRECSQLGAREFAKRAFYMDEPVKLMGQKVQEAIENVNQRKHDVQK